MKEKKVNQEQLVEMIRKYAKEALKENFSKRHHDVEAAHRVVQQMSHDIEDEYGSQAGMEFARRGHDLVDLSNTTGELDVKTLEKEIKDKYKENYKPEVNMHQESKKISVETLREMVVKAIHEVLEEETKIKD